jgi:dCTP deaminase
VAFWSGERWLKELEAQPIIDHPDPAKIDCSAYTLTLGPEYFISPDYSAPPSAIVKKRLQPATEELVGKEKKDVPGETVAIPPGQFAYLQTEEVIRIPKNAMGLISLKFGVKGPGLINVSGFHVDPGYYGRLIFSVYNAGSQPARLHRQQDVFLLWMADLDQESTYAKAATDTPANESISEDMVAKVDRPIHSLQGLSDRLERLNDKVELIASVAKAVGVFAGIVVAIATLIVGIWALRPAETAPPRVFQASLLK